MKKQLAITIGGHVIPVVVTKEGIFWAEWEGDSYRSETFKGLRAKLLPEVRDDLKRCELPAMMKNYHDAWEEITLIGIHAANGNVLYLDAEGKTHQSTPRRDGRIFRVLTQAELREYDRLVAKVDMAQRAAKAWLVPRSLIPGEAVRKAIGLAPEPERAHDHRADSLDWATDDDDIT